MNTIRALLFLYPHVFPWFGLSSRMEVLVFEDLLTGSPRATRAQKCISGHCNGVWETEQGSAAFVCLRQGADSRITSGLKKGRKMLLHG